MNSVIQIEKGFCVKMSGNQFVNSGR
jgi:hypothetical protein